ncbi:hypothetical protein [Flavobacterium sp.]|jgi:hypothetical protein|uniref:hypothetical protein n=1 Tax=Flavobacterium sp. TaxID=239 RepID=UPI0037BF4F10
MKKITLVVASILLLGNVAKASELNFTDEGTRTRFSFDEPISFTERGIEFFVFPNGDFDFNTRPEDSHGDYNYRLAGKRTSAAERRNRNTPVNFGVLIEHDSFGRVRRVGNTFINYDNQDRVSRIGTVYMRYNRFALTQVGGMQIVYNRRGEIVDMIGQVKGRRAGFTYSGYATNYQNTNHNQSQNQSYYYRTDGTKALVDEDKKEGRN